ncbi:MAG: ribosome biogenesis GTP-binding protein YihA/YsxC [Pseudomonadota bacterium]
MAAGRRLFERQWTFEKGVVAIDGLPDPQRAEVAFAGRSNVGKSSLINALVRQNGLARTSNTPGRTQELNFFGVDGVPIAIVDMPGYGYAKAPKAKVDTWTGLIKDYLRGRQALARVFLLIDSRHGIKANDEAIMALLDESAVTYQVTLTKADKIKTAGLARLIDATIAIIKQHPAAYPDVLATSSEKGIGIEELRAEIVMATRLAPDSI